MLWYFVGSLLPYYAIALLVVAVIAFFTKQIFSLIDPFSSPLAAPGSSRWFEATPPDTNNTILTNRESGAAGSWEWRKA